MQTSYNVIELDVSAFYKTRTTEKIFTFSRRASNQPLSEGWKIAHWEEFLELFNEQKNHNFRSLIDAARFYFHYHTQQLADLVESFGLSLPELSLVIKQYQTQGRIFIPNISIKRATIGIYHRHGSLDDFLSSTSCNLICNIAQNTAANPEQAAENAVKNQRFKAWINQYGGKARGLLKKSLKLHPGERFVEGDSPDISLAQLNHPLYEEIAQRVVLEKKIEQTLQNNK